MWYVRVTEDGETLEVTSSGNFSDLSGAHRDLVSAMNTGAHDSQRSRYGDSRSAGKKPNKGYPAENGRFTVMGATSEQAHSWN